MIVKWILCEVHEGMEEAFSRGQRAWQALATAPGLIGQWGGWVKGTEVGRHRAGILALWRDEAALAHFTAELHDPIYLRSGQAQTIQTCQVRLAKPMLQLHSAGGGAFNSASVGDMLRVAECPLRDATRKAHALEAQFKIWNPAMSASPAFRGGFFSADIKEQQYLVVSFWHDDENRASYAARAATELLDEAGVHEDYLSIIRYDIPIEPDWTVVPSPI